MSRVQTKTLGDVADYINGRAFKPKEWKKSGLPIIRIQNLNKPEAVYNYTDERFEEKYLVNNGDLLYAWSASLGAHIWKGENAWLNQHIFKVHPREGVDKGYLYYFLAKVTGELYAKAHGSGMVHVTKKKFEATEISIPPLDEQKRIVAKIEILFSELDKGIESLKTARQQLKAYRQAVLKHAFEGKLTEQWRQQNPDKLENPEQLLARIQQEREQRYRQQLEKWKQTIEVWKESGKEGKKPSKPKKARGEPEPFVDEIEVPPLWGVTTVGALNVDVSDGPFGSNLKSSDYVDHGVRVIRLENVGYMEFIEDKHSYVTEEKYEKLKKHTVSGGDLIFSSFITEGVRTVILPEKIDRAINKADCFCIRVHGRLYLTEFLAWFLSSRSAYKQVESEIHGIGRPRINTTQLKRFTIPICSIDEQKEVVSKINAILSDTDHMEETLDNEVQRAEALRQSILKKAFFGQLTRSTN